MRIAPSAGRRYCTNSGPPVLLIKYPHISDPCCPCFTGGAKCAKFWPKFRPQSSSNRRICELWRFIGKQKQTCQGSMIGLPLYQTWGDWVPQLPEPLSQWVPQRVKVENFLYILRFSGPRRVQRHQCYTTYWGRSCCKDYRAVSPNSPPTFYRGGAKIGNPY